MGRKDITQGKVEPDTNDQPHAKLPTTMKNRCVNRVRAEAEKGEWGRNWEGRGC